MNNNSSSINPPDWTVLYNCVMILWVAQWVAPRVSPQNRLQWERYPPPTPRDAWMQAKATCCYTVWRHLTGLFKILSQMLGAVQIPNWHHNFHYACNPSTNLKVADIHYWNMLLQVVQICHHSEIRWGNHCLNVHVEYPTLHGIRNMNAWNSLPSGCYR